MFLLHVGVGGNLGGSAPFYLQSPVWLRHFIRAGGAGVTLFFVLSGFIMAYVYAGRVMQPRGFLIARAARILPMYWFALLLALPLDWRRLASNPSAFIAAPTLTQGWVTHLAYIWNSPGWSLCCEAFFYALFPLLLPVLDRLPRRTLLVIVLGGGLTAALIPLLPLPAVALYTFPAARLPEFLVGSALCHWSMQYGGWRRWAPLLTVGGAVVAFAALAFRPVPLEVARQGLALPFAALILGVSTPHVASRWLGWPPLVMLGHASYAFYVLHMPVARSLSRVMGASGEFALVAFLLTVALSLALHSVLEKPARTYVRARLTRPSR